MAIPSALTGPDIFQMAMAYQKSQVLHTSCALGVFEALHACERTAEAVAIQIQADADATERLLNACVALQLLNKHVDGEGVATYKNCAATETFLVSSGAMSMLSLIMKHEEMFYGLWGKLKQSVHTGHCQLLPMSMMGDQGAMPPLNGRDERPATNGHGHTPHANGHVEVAQSLNEDCRPEVNGMNSVSSHEGQCNPPPRRGQGQGASTEGQRNSPHDKGQGQACSTNGHGPTPGPANGHGTDAPNNGHVVTASPGSGSESEMFKKGGNFYKNKNKMLEFMQCMHTFSVMDATLAVKAFDLSEFTAVCDLGGSTGALGLQLATRYPQIQTTVLDLAPVISMAPQFLPKTRLPNLSLVAGDFFKGALPPADLYILSHVLHDWNASKIDELLRKVYLSLNPGGALLVLEKILTEEKDGDVTTMLFDLGMLLVSKGRERNFPEYKTMLEAHGFEEIAIRKLPDICLRDVILARRM